MKTTFFVSTISPFTNIGLISTELEYDRVHQIDQRLSIIEFKSPHGKPFVFDASTGAFLGNDLGLVLKDFQEFKNDGKWVELLAERRTQLIKMREDAKKLERMAFWRALHAG